MRKLKPSGIQGFQRLGVPGEDGRFRRVVRFQCRDCPNTLDINDATASELPPDFLVRKAIRAGWSADSINANIARCPQCIAVGKAKFLDQRSLPFPPSLITSSDDPNLFVPSPPSLSVLERREKRRMSSAANTDRRPPSVIVVPSSAEDRYKGLTYDQKRALREKIEGTFDDKTGSYLDDWTDERIGKELDLPPVLVAFVRERDYGKLLPPSDLVKLEARVDAWQREFQSIKAELERLRGRFAA